MIDFQQHHTPAELLKGDPKSLTARVDERGNPTDPLNPLLADLSPYEGGGWEGPEPCGELGAHRVRFGIQELALSQCVFATDYPQAIRDPGEVSDYIKAVEALDPNSNALIKGLNAEKLIPNNRERVARRKR